MDPELQRRLDHEFRAEMAAWEAEAAAVGRPLAVLLGDLVAAEATVRLDLRFGSITGIIVHSASDLVCLAAARRWDVRVPAIVRLQLVGDGGGAVGWTQAPSFAARLREVRTAADPVLLACGDGVEVEGVVTEAGPDHLVVGGRSGTVVPLSQVAAVTTG